MWIKCDDALYNLDHMITIRLDGKKLTIISNGEHKGEKGHFDELEFENENLANREFKKIYDALRAIRVHFDEE